jgi:hypothetical protein
MRPPGLLPEKAKDARRNQAFDTKRPESHHDG